MDHRRTESGAAAIEFALVLPLLLTMMFGFINFGVYFAQSLALDNAAREGARFGAVRDHQCSEIYALAEESATSLAMTGADVTATVTEGDCGGIDGPCTGSAPGDRIELEVTHTYELLVPMPIPGFPTSFDLTGHGEFRCEYS